MRSRLCRDGSTRLKLVTGKVDSRYRLHTLTRHRRPMSDLVLILSVQMPRKRLSSSPAKASPQPSPEILSALSSLPLRSISASALPVSRHSPRSLPARGPPPAVPHQPRPVSAPPPTPSPLPRRSPAFPQSCAWPHDLDVGASPRVVCPYPPEAGHVRCHAACSLEGLDVDFFILPCSVPTNHNEFPRWRPPQHAPVEAPLRHRALPVHVRKREGSRD